MNDEAHMMARKSDVVDKWFSQVMAEKIADEILSSCDGGEDQVSTSYTRLTIVFKDGTKREFYSSDSGDGTHFKWDDYEYDGKFIVVKFSGAWVAMYSADDIKSVELT